MEAIPLVTEEDGGAKTAPASKRRFFIFLNGQFTGGKVITVGSDLTWDEFKALCLRKLSSHHSGHKQEQQQEQPPHTNARLWLGSGAEVEGMEELESGDVLYVSFNPRQSFIAPPAVPLASASSSFTAKRTGPLTGLLIYQGRQHYVQLLPHTLCWALQGDVYHKLPLAEVVGVSRSRAKSGFILHSYPLRDTNKAPGLNNDRYLKTHEFTCPNESVLLIWLEAVRTVLKQPFYPPSAAALATAAGDGSGGGSSAAAAAASEVNGGGGGGGGGGGDDDNDNGEDQRVSANGIKPRRLLVFINPFGGTGTARAKWKQVRPMFLVANINIHLVVTKHAGHAGEVAASLDVQKYDGIVTISGDGLLHEVVNALLRRPDWKDSVKVPLGIIPGGSGNGLAASISCYTANQAAFAIVKGRARPFDVFSILQEGQRKRFGFLDLAWGFISDVDFESEVFRWMGKARFTVTALEKLVSNIAYRARVSLLLADFAPQPCVQIHCPVCVSSLYALHASEILRISAEALAVEPEKLYQGDGDQGDNDDDSSNSNRSDAAEASPPRLLQQLVADGEEDKFDDEEDVGPRLVYIGRKADKANWKVIEDNFSLFVASNVRGISTDTFLTPYAHLSDGCLDICFMRSATRANLTRVLLENEKGDGAHLDIEGVEYVKVRALVIEPLVLPNSKAGKMGVDGEILPPTAVRLEVHQALLSLFHPHC